MLHFDATLVMCEAVTEIYSVRMPSTSAEHSAISSVCQRARVLNRQTQIKHCGQR